MRDSPLANPIPLLLEFDMELGGLENPNEHENEATPSAYDLYGPTASFVWKSGQNASIAVIARPKYIPSWCCALSRCTIGPWWISIPSGAAVRISRGWETHHCVGATAIMP